MTFIINSDEAGKAQVTLCMTYFDIIELQRMTPQKKGNDTVSHSHGSTGGSAAADGRIVFSKTNFSFKFP